MASYHKSQSRHTISFVVYAGSTFPTSRSRISIMYPFLCAPGSSAVTDRSGTLDTDTSTNYLLTVSTAPKTFSTSMVILLQHELRGAFDNCVCTAAWEMLRSQCSLTIDFPHDCVYLLLTSFQPRLKIAYRSVLCLLLFLLCLCVLDKFSVCHGQQVLANLSL